MYPRRNTTQGFGGFGGLLGPIPRDLLILFGVLFVTFVMQFFAATQFIELLRLTRLVWRGFVWQLATYPFIGYGEGLFFLLSFIFLYMFARDAFYGLGRRHFWRLVLAAAVGSALVALLADFLLQLAGWRYPPFVLMQGQLLLGAVLVAAFATAHPDATIYLLVFPIQARWFIHVEILLAFVGFLPTKDVPGFLGICTAVGIGYWYVRSGGGRRLTLREIRLRLERRWIQWKLDRGKRKRGFRVIPGERDRSGEVRKGPWVH